jgi:hypothetical protein
MSAAEPAPPATAAPAAAGDCLIDLPQKSDAAAIARYFFEVYGHAPHRRILADALRAPSDPTDEPARPLRVHARAAAAA